MSTTVSYKGSALTTVSNQQRTLATAGKWMEADVILSDTTPSAPSGTKQISITQNGTTTENVSGYESAQITVNVSGGGTPSQTHHIIDFEFSDSTSAAIEAYWDGTFISDAIRATTPATYNNKTVTEASLDGIAWYTYSPSAETWNTIYEGTTQYNADQTEQYPYCWISSLSNIYPTDGSVWRITWNGTVYRCTAATVSGVVVIGNPKYATGDDDGSNVPFAFANQGWGAWSGLADLPNQEAQIPVKIEQLVSS